jgi:hypothetical protein
VHEMKQTFMFLSIQTQNYRMSNVRFITVMNE